MSVRSYMKKSKLGLMEGSYLHGLLYKPFKCALHGRDGVR